MCNFSLIQIQLLTWFRSDIPTDLNISIHKAVFWFFSQRYAIISWFHISQTIKKTEQFTVAHEIDNESTSDAIIPDNSTRKLKLREHLNDEVHVVLVDEYRYQKLLAREYNEREPSYILSQDLYVGRTRSRFVRAYPLKFPTCSFFPLARKTGRLSIYR